MTPKEYRVLNYGIRVLVSFKNGSLFM